MGSRVFRIGARDRAAPGGTKRLRGTPEAVGVVERTFGWLGRYRRLSKDYEELPQSEETLILVAMINLMVHRLEPD